MFIFYLGFSNFYGNIKSNNQENNEKLSQKNPHR